MTLVAVKFLWVNGSVTKLRRIWPSSVMVMMMINDDDDVMIPDYKIGLTDHCFEFSNISESCQIFIYFVAIRELQKTSCMNCED